MNPAVEQLFAEYLQRTGEIAAAASLTLADVMQSSADRVEATPPGQPFTVAEAAKRLNISACTVYELCQKGRLSHHRVGRAIRITLADIAAFQQETAETAEPRQSGRYRLLDL